MAPCHTEQWSEGVHVTNAAHSSAPAAPTDGTCNLRSRNSGRHGLDQGSRNLRHRQTSASPGLDSAVQFRPLLLPRRLRYSRPAQRRVHQYKHVSTERRSALEAVKGGRQIGGNALFHVHLVLLRALLPQPCVHVHEELLHVECQAMHSAAISTRISASRTDAMQ